MARFARRTPGFVAARDHKRQRIQVNFERWIAILDEASVVANITLHKNRSR